MSDGSTFRTGAFSVLGIKEETVFGTFDTAEAFMPFNSESLKVVAPKVKVESINGTRFPFQYLKGPEHVAGSVECNFNVGDDLCMVLLKQALGGTVSSLRNGAAGSYAHTFYMGDMDHNKSTSGAADVKSLSFSIRRGETSTGCYAYSGCRVNQLTLKGDIGKPVTMTAELIGVAGSLTTMTLTPAFSAIEPILFSGVSIREQATVTSCLSATADIFTSFELTLNNNLVSDDTARQLGSRQLAVLPQGMAEVTVKLTQRYDTTTAWAKWLDYTTSAIVISMLGTLTCTAQAADTVYSAHLQLPYCMWGESAQPVVSGPGLITHELSPMPYMGNTSTGYVLQVVAHNNTANY